VRVQCEPVRRSAAVVKIPDSFKRTLTAATNSRASAISNQNIRTPNRCRLTITTSSSQKRNTCFREFLPVLGVKLKRRLCEFWLFFEIDLCSVTSIESSRRNILNYMAEYRSIMKSSHTTYEPLSIFIPKTGMNFQKEVHCFYCVCL